MAFRATARTLHENYAELKYLARTIKTETDIFLGELAADIPAMRVIGYANQLEQLRDDMVALESANVAQYAQDQEGSVTYNVQAEYLTTKTAINSALTWVRNNFPVSGGYLAAREFVGPSSTHTQDRMLTPAQTSVLVTVLQSVTNSIE